MNVSARPAMLLCPLLLAALTACGGGGSDQPAAARESAASAASASADAGRLARLAERQARKGDPLAPPSATGPTSGFDTAQPTEPVTIPQATGAVDLPSYGRVEQSAFNKFASIVGRSAAVNPEVFSGQDTSLDGLARTAAFICSSKASGEDPTGAMTKAGVQPLAASIEVAAADTSRICRS